MGKLESLGIYLPGSASPSVEFLGSQPFWTSYMDVGNRTCVASTWPTKPLLQPQNTLEASQAVEASVTSHKALVYRWGQVAWSLWLLVDMRESKLSLGNRSHLIIETWKSSWLQASAYFSHSSSLAQRAFSQRKICSVAAPHSNSKATLALPWSSSL